LTVDGVSINITTKADQVVPQFIGGLTENATRVEAVTVKNLVITGAGMGNNNEAYNNTLPSYIGWMVANSSDLDKKIVNYFDKIGDLSSAQYQVTDMTCTGAYVTDGVYRGGYPTGSTTDNYNTFTLADACS
jgi:hypothetical protein